MSDKPDNADQKEAEQNKAILLRRREVAARVMLALSDEMGTTKLTSPDDVTTVIAAVAAVGASVLQQVSAVTKLHPLVVQDMFNSAVVEAYIQIENERQARIQKAN